MFMTSGRIRRERAKHHARATAIVAAAVLFANLVAIVGLGSVARAGEIHSVTPYAPITWEKKSATSLDGEARVQTVASIVRVDRNTLQAATETGKRNFAEVPATAPQHRALLVIVMIAALGALIGISAQMFRSLVRDFEKVGRKRRDFMS
jgi:hypothetical protein